ncbi:MAG TPA: CheR family methyltransferase [Kofleriaceae bacterium]|nr:CheR family methyltransferase [Kofleriaceae bacterium]
MTAAALSTPPAPLPYDEARLKKLASLINSELGIKMPDGKLTMLHGRLQRRVHHLGLRSLAEYEARLRDPAHGQDEHVHLLDLATTNKTDFFREPAHFTFLTQKALPTLSTRGDRWTCRVWCAGCSTGQEVYTLAMVLDDYARGHPGFGFEITATDISTRVLREAQAATYHASLVEPVSAEFRQRYLMRGKAQRAGMVRVVPELRQRVKFHRLNFMDRQYPVGEVDVVFFRNVLIYFDRPTQKAVLERQAGHLRPGGYLFIGHTESAAGLGLSLVNESSSILRRPP